AGHAHPPGQRAASDRPGCPPLQARARRHARAGPGPGARGAGELARRVRLARRAALGRRRLRVAGVQAVRVERDRPGKGPRDDRHRRRTDESRRRRPNRRREGFRVRARHDRRLARIGRVLPISRRAAAGARRRRDRNRPARRIAPRRRRDPGGRARRRRDGLHRPPPLPALASPTGATPAECGTVPAVATRGGTMTEADPRRWQALTVVCAAFFMTILDVSIVNVALPSIGTSLHFSQDNLQWVITAYAITYGGFLLLAGRLADLYGRRRVFMIGV